MRLGATLAHLSPGPPYAVATWARRLVDAGFESLWTPEIIGRGALVPDPFVALAAAAGATEDVELGTATVQVPLHHPVELAHRVLSLAAVCGERLTLGVSPGSTAADYAALDRDHGTRFQDFRGDAARVRELVAHGHDQGTHLAPAADAAPRLPVLLGSWGAGVERAAREFDGWLASGYRSSVDEVVTAHERFRAAGGRRAVVCAVPVADDLAVTRDALARYAEAGLDDAVLLFAPGGPDPEHVRSRLA